MRHQPPRSRSSRTTTPIIHSRTTSGSHARGPVAAISTLDRLRAAARFVSIEAACGTASVPGPVWPGIDTGAPGPVAKNDRDSAAAVTSGAASMATSAAHASA
jgi:hypothetical protein